MGRLILAVLFLVGGMGLTIVLLSMAGDRTPPGVLSVVTVVAFFILLALGMVWFGDRGAGGWSQIQHWEEKGLLASTSYRAKRAFQVEEWEDEGSHYFIELEDGSVLYLNGQYLYEYEAIEDDDEDFHQPRRFPCTEFTIRRHQFDGFVVDILCGGEVLEPEEMQPAFTAAEVRAFNLGDGEIIRDRTYDELKGRRRKPDASNE